MPCMMRKLPPAPPSPSWRKPVDEKLKSCPPERFVEPFEGMLAEIVICHQLRTSAGLMDAEYTRRMGRPTTSDRAQRMRDAADLIEALARPSDRNDVIEECAKVADGYRMKIIGIPSACIDDTAEGIAKAIRARKDQEHG